MKSGASTYRPEGRGPFRVEHLQPGDPYELSDGHAIASEPAGRRHGRRNLAGGAVIDTDPAVEAAAVDTGYALTDVTLRAPDVSVGGLEDEPGFAVGAPALAVEYAERGGGERDLERKIGELLAAGTAIVWVVRLDGERRVEVHRPDRPPEIRRSGDDLDAPGILRNPVPVDALYDRDVAHEVTLRNLLQRRGYASLEAIRAAALAEGHEGGRAEGRAEGQAQGQAQGRVQGRVQGRAEGAIAHARATLLRVIELREIAVLPEDRAAIESCGELGVLDEWLSRAVVAARREDVFRS